MNKFSMPDWFKKAEIMANMAIVKKQHDLDHEE
jgi:hypothetical protein